MLLLLRLDYLQLFLILISSAHIKLLNITITGYIYDGTRTHIYLANHYFLGFYSLYSNAVNFLIPVLNSSLKNAQELKNDVSERLH